MDMRGEHVKVCAVTDSRLLGKLTSEAEFSCSRCGAKAHDRDSVCEPVPFEPDH
jgi:ribosomal protein L37E